MTRVPSPYFPRASLVLLLLTGLGSTATADPIRGRRVMIEAARANPLEAYFASALRRHALDIHMDAALRHTTLAGMEHVLGVDGQLPDTAFVRYLRWRRGLHALRFDANHPRLASLLQAVRARQFTPSTAPPRVDGLLIGPPQQAPEPSTWLVALGLIATGAAYRRLVR